MAQGTKAVTGGGAGLGERGMSVALGVMKVSMQIAVWEGNLCPGESTLWDGLPAEEGAGILLSWVGL